MRCDQCKFWKEFYGGFGECNKMKEKVELQIESGWDGYNFITFETENDFGCVLFEKIELK